MKPVEKQRMAWAEDGLGAVLRWLGGLCVCVCGGVCIQGRISSQRSLRIMPWVKLGLGKKTGTISQLFVL